MHSVYRRKLRTLGFLLALGVSSAAWAGSVLPDALPGLQALDPQLNNGGPRSMIDQEADRHGLTCREFREFNFTDQQAAVSAVTDWLNAHGLTATTEARNDIFSDWKATNGRENVFVVWLGTRLHLCQGDLFDVTARNAAHAEAVRQVDAMSHAANVPQPSNPAPGGRSLAGFLALVAFIAARMLRRC